jgi:phosphatidylserine decarboxylase
MRINKEGRGTIVFVFFSAALFTYLLSILSMTAAYVMMALGGCLTLFVTFFFRDPDRNPPQDQNLIIAPADGKVVQFVDIEHHEYIGGPAKQISIFLSVMDVHVNRVPASGIIEYAEYFPGKYLVAWKDEASIENERAEFGLKHSSGLKIYFKQITGLLARRIQYDLEVGRSVEAGERFGIMKFGSRMDVIVPSDVELKVSEGDKTRAGESILAVIKG